MRTTSLNEIVLMSRRIHERLLSETIGTHETHGSCLYAAVLLAESARNFGSCTKVLIRGGDGVHDGGYIDSHGIKHGHYWVEASTHEGDFVLDITADQFGDDPCLVLRAKESLEHYRPGDQSIVDSHVSELLVSCTADAAPAVHDRNAFQETVAV